MTAIIYLVRHSETTWNRIGRLQGRADSPLTLHGTKQAEAAGRCLRPCLVGKDFSVWSSPQRRSRQTAAIICDIIDHDYEDVIIDDRLMDISLGDRDGYVGWHALARDFPDEAEERRRDPWHYCHPNGESSHMVQERVRPLFETWRSAGGTHLVVSHGVPIKILRGLHLGLNEAETYALDRAQDVVHRLSGTVIDGIGLDLS